MNTPPARTPLPKAELHCHMEGTISPVAAQRLALRHDLDLGDLIDADGRYVWRGFAEFLTAYDRVSQAVRTPEDYYDITYFYYQAAAAEGLIYGEMFVSAVHPGQHGISYPTFVEAVAAAMDDVERDCGVAARMVLTGVRHCDVDSVIETARLAEKHPHPKVTGFGMAGNEAFRAPKDFARAFEIAAGAGLKLTAHAGEFGGPDSVARALADLNVARIGHGVRAIEDRAVLDLVRDSGVALEVCPSSNVALGLYPSVAEHPVRRLGEHGVNTTLGSDDPPFFFTTIGGEYERVAAAHGFSPLEMAGFTRRAIDAAFCEPELQARLHAKIAQWVAALPMD